MNIKEWIDLRYKDLSKEELQQKHYDKLTILTDALIDALSIPEVDEETGETGFYRDQIRCDKFGVQSDREPINWETYIVLMFSGSTTIL